MNIGNLTVKQLSDAISSGKLSSSEVTHYFHYRIQNDDVNAFITVENDLEKHSNGILSGIPVGIKDNICTSGLRTTCGSKMLKNFIPPYDATVVSLLKSAGAVIAGKLNMDEFGMGSSCKKSYFGPVYNPYNKKFVAGGSSGGSAAAVAAGLVPFALGSDTGGSIRIPASFCGVVGFKPTYGRVSRYGLVSFAPSLDHVGIITKDVYDTAFILNLISGFDPYDSTSSKQKIYNFTADIEDGVSGMKIAIPDELLNNSDCDIKKSVISAAAILEKAGADIEYISFDFFESALAAYYIISSAEASSNLARFDGVRFGHRSSVCSDIEELYKNSRSEGFGDEVKRRIMLGTFVLSAGYIDDYYRKAQRVRDSLREKLTSLFDKYDFILSPVSPVKAYKLKENTTSSIDMYYQDICNVSANLAGLPAISVPFCKDENNMPIGVQLIGKAFGESELFRAAFVLEDGVGRGIDAEL